MVLSILLWLAAPSAVADEPLRVPVERLKTKRKPYPSLPTGALGRYEEGDLRCDVDLLVEPTGEVSWVVAAPYSCPPSVATEVERVAKRWAFHPTGHHEPITTSVLFSWDVRNAVQILPHQMPSRPVTDDTGTTRHLINAEGARQPAEFPKSMTATCTVEAKVDMAGRVRVRAVTGCMAPFAREAARAALSMRFRPPVDGEFTFTMGVPFGG